MPWCTCSRESDHAPCPFVGVDPRHGDHFPNDVAIRRDAHCPCSQACGTCCWCDWRKCDRYMQFVDARVDERSAMLWAADECDQLASAIMLGRCMEGVRR